MLLKRTILKMAVVAAVAASVTSPGPQGGFAATAGDESPRGPSTQPAGETPVRPGQRTRPARWKHTRAGPRATGPLTDEQQAEVLAFLKKHRARHYERLMELRRGSPVRYQKALRMIYWRIRPAINLPEDAQRCHFALWEATMRIRRLVRELRRGDPAGKDELIEKLTQAVAKRFDADRRIREFRLARLEERIRQLREQLKQQAERRDELIRRQVNKILQATTAPFEPERRSPADRRQPADPD